jgi:hypothetical protein
MRVLVLTLILASLAVIMSRAWRADQRDVESFVGVEKGMTLTEAKGSLTSAGWRYARYRGRSFSSLSDRAFCGDGQPHVFLHMTRQEDLLLYANENCSVSRILRRKRSLALDHIR